MEQASPLTTRKIKVALVIPSLEAGGSENHVSLTARKLDRRHFEARILCLNAKGPFAVDAERDGIAVELLSPVSPSAPAVSPYPPGRYRFVPQPLRRFRRSLINLRKDWSHYRTLCSAFQRERPDIVHAHLYEARSAILAARACRVPVILFTLHSVSKDRANEEYLPRRLVRRLYEETDSIIAVSNAVKESLLEYEGLHPEKIRTIYDMYDLGQYHQPISSRGHPTTFGIVGSLRALKGHIFFVQAARQVVEVCPETRFLIYGEGELRQELARYVESLSLQEKVVFMGSFDNRTNLVRVMAEIDILVSASLSEALSISVLEAMAFQKPVIATKVGGVPEVVVDGETGVLVPARDASALAEAMLTLLSSPERARAMGIAGRARVEAHFSSDVILRQIEELYDELVAQKKPI